MVVVIAHFQQAVARAQGALERRHPAGMLAVDRQHQPVEKPPPLRCRAEEQSVHRRRQPHHAQMIAEGGGGSSPARGRSGSAGWWRRPRCRAASMPVPSVARPSAPSTSADTAHEPSPWIVGDVVERGAAQAASGRQKRDRLDAIGLAGAVRPHQHHHVAARLQARRAIIAEVRQRQAVDAGGGHVGGGAIFLPSPLVGEGGAARS